MTTYRLSYERAKEAAGTPWALEDPTGERRYTAKVVVQCHAETVLVPADPRYHGYLEITGVLDYAKDCTTLR